MTRLSLEQQILLALQVAVLVGLCARLVRTGLDRKYRYFFAYLILSVVQVTVLPLIPLNSRLYLDAWMVSETLATAAYAMVVLETYTLILRDLPGIASAARRYLKMSMAVAAIASLLLVALGRTPARGPQYFLVCERTVISTLLVFVLSALAFLAYYPVPLSRNVLSYSIGFAVYLLVKTMTLLVVNLGYSPLYRLITNAQLGVAIVCPLFWLLALSPVGEAKTVRARPSWTLDNEKQVLSRLRAINDNLTRPGKK
jgi:hypothetical protein